MLPNHEFGIVGAMARTPLTQLAALSPRLQMAALTVMLKQHNAPVCKGILLKKLTEWESSRSEYELKAPEVLKELIADLIRRTTALRFALGLPMPEVSPPAKAFVSADHLRTTLQVAARQRTHEWIAAALSSTEAMKGGSVGAWIQGVPAQPQ